MVDISAIGAALSALKAAKDVGQAMIGLRDAAAFQERLIEFQSKILEAQDRAFAAHDERSMLIEEVRDLREEIASLKKWESEKGRYELRSIAEYGGVFVYALKESSKSPEEPIHSICPTCYESAKKSILHFEQRVGGAQVYVCHLCGTELYKSGFRQKDHGSPPSRRR